MPAFPRPCTVAVTIQISCDMLRSIAFMHILVENNPNYGSFTLVDVQFVQFVLALVDAATFHKVTSKAEMRRMVMTL